MLALAARRLLGLLGRALTALGRALATLGRALTALTGALAAGRLLGAGLVVNAVPADLGGVAGLSGAGTEFTTELSEHSEFFGLFTLVSEKKI